MMFRRFLFSILLVFSFACSTAEVQKRTVVVNIPAEQVPGTYNNVWQEPIIDTVRVPGQLDPTNTYYRASHRTVVEIRPGRVQEVQFPRTEAR